MLNRKIRQLTLYGAVLGLILTLVACGSAPATPYERVVEASFSPGSPIPGSSGETILTISGEISVKNSGDTLSFDMPTLEKLGLVRYTITDPWRADEQVSYTGVLMSDLIKFAGVSDSATSIHMVALDDYEVDISIADIHKWPILLASRTDGEYMNIDDGGPTRIIYPFGKNLGADQPIYRDLSIWNVVTMEVK